MSPLRADVSGGLLRPDDWRELALSLLASAEVLWSTPQPGGMHLRAGALLAAFGVENMLKAIRIKQKLRAKEPVVKDGALTNDLTKHNLLPLAKQSGFDLEPQEEFLLKRFTATINWEGRYVVPKRLGAVDIFGASSTDRDNVRRLMWRLGMFYDEIT
jgi:hypothetical protein